MTNSYDAIVLGAGHNGLILQAYLGQLGLRTICLERRATLGGGLTTTEFPVASGFWHNTHSFFHRGVTEQPWYQDLGLQQRGACYIEPDLNVALICPNGRSVQWWKDTDRTICSFAEISPQDAATLRSWQERFQSIVQDILIPESQQPPLPPDVRRRQLEKTDDGRLLLSTSQLSPLEFVEREFEHPTVKAALLFFNGLREVDLRLPGFGHHIPALLAAERFAQMCVGGSQQLACALARTVRETGGNIELNAAPRQICVEAGRVTGVETESGDLLRAGLVVSSLNPQQTFLELLDARYVPQQWKQQAEKYHYNLLAPLFALYVNLDAPPHYQAAEHAPHLDEALMVILGLDRVEQFHEILLHHEKGTFPPSVMWGSCPTRFDPSQAPPGKHTAFMWEKLPYKLHAEAGHWDQLKRDHGQKLLKTWQQYAPNLAASDGDWFTQSPLDTERTLVNMRYGDLLVGSFDRGQIGYHRPFPGAGHYRGHLPGLYLCGSSCHPGGNITGLPGYNCAQVLRADLRLN